MNSTSSHFGPIMAAARLDSVVEASPIPFIAGGVLLMLLALWFCSLQETLNAASRARRFEVEANAVLSWLAHHRRHRVLGRPVPGSISCHQVFQNEPTWGGLCVDERASIGKRSRRWQGITAARGLDSLANPLHRHGRAMEPHHRYNLTGDRSIPFTTYAKFIVDTATSLGKAGTRDFQKPGANAHRPRARNAL